MKSVKGWMEGAWDETNGMMVGGVLGKVTWEMDKHISSIIIQGIFVDA